MAPVAQTASAIPADHNAYLSKPVFANLDGLRFLCISAVIWHHLPLWKEVAPQFQLAARGHTGVDFFFVLSGFMITAQLLREEKANGRFSLRAFYWRRALRILPVYFFVVTIACCYAIFVQGRTDQIHLVPYYYLFLTNFLVVPDIGFLSPMWSLAMEEQFYLVWPALLLLLPRKWILPCLGVLIAINLTAILGLFAYIGITGIDAGPARFAIKSTTYTPLLMGAALAYVLHSPKGYALLDPVLGFIGAPVFWLLALLCSLHFIPGALVGVPNMVVHSLMTLSLGSLVVREHNTLAPVLQWRPIARIGQISYGIYLYHLIALTVVAKMFEAFGWTNLALVGLLYYALAVVIAEISFRTLEAWPMTYRKKGWGRLGGLGGR